MKKEKDMEMNENMKKTMKFLGIAIGIILVFWGTAMNYADPALLGMFVISYSL